MLRKMKNNGTYDAKDDVLLVLRAIRNFQYFDLTGKYVALLLFFVAVCLFVC
jgi:hypothetical protein